MHLSLSRLRNLVLPALLACTCAAPALAHQAPLVNWVAQNDLNPHEWMAQCTPTRREMVTAAAQDTPFSLIQRACILPQHPTPGGKKREVIPTPGYVFIPASPSEMGNHFAAFRFDTPFATPYHFIDTALPMDQRFVPWIAADPEHPGAAMAQCSPKVRIQNLPTTNPMGSDEALTIFTHACSDGDILSNDSPVAIVLQGTVFIPANLPH